MLQSCNLSKVASLSNLGQAVVGSIAWRVAGGGDRSGCWWSSQSFFPMLMSCQLDSSRLALRSATLPPARLLPLQQHLPQRQAKPNWGQLVSWQSIPRQLSLTHFLYISRRLHRGTPHIPGTGALALGPRYNQWGNHQKLGAKLLLQQSTALIGKKAVAKGAQLWHKRYQMFSFYN